MFVKSSTRGQEDTGCFLVHEQSAGRKAELNPMGVHPIMPRTESPVLLRRQEEMSRQSISVRSNNSTESSREASPKERGREATEEAEHGYTAKNHKRHFVHHNYHDHADDVDPAFGNASEPDATEDNAVCGGKSKRGSINLPFPEKLHGMLDRIEKDGYASIISWQPHGRAFIVHKHKEFVDIIMPKYFRQSKISSFQRQLNLYGFCRLTRGRDKGAYYHELFLRGRIFLCKGMARTRIKGTGIKASSSPDSEPNFYSMKPCFPLSNDDGPLASSPWASSVEMSQPCMPIAQGSMPQAESNEISLLWQNFQNESISQAQSNEQILNPGQMTFLTPESNQDPVSENSGNVVLLEDPFVDFSGVVSEQVCNQLPQHGDFGSSLPQIPPQNHSTFVSPITSRILDPAMLQRLHAQYLEASNQSTIQTGSDDIIHDDGAPKPMPSIGAEEFAIFGALPQSPQTAATLMTMPHSAEASLPLGTMPALQDYNVPQHEAGEKQLPLSKSGPVSPRRDPVTLEREMAVSRAVRQLSLVNFADISLFEAERRDAQAMDDFFAEFEDGEMAALIDVVATHDNDEVLGDVLDHLMDSL